MAVFRAARGPPAKQRVWHAEEALWASGVARLAAEQVSQRLDSKLRYTRAPAMVRLIAISLSARARSPPCMVYWPSHEFGAVSRRDHGLWPRPFLP
jgi:hypothetical protein